MQVKFDEKILYQKCKECRKLILQLTYNMGNIGAHIGGGLSLVEILVVLYSLVMNLDKTNPRCENRDRLILSKGHGTLALYTAMYISGFISYDELFTYKGNGSIFSAHPHINQDKLIEFSSGSLGQGLSIGVGVALALKLKGNFDSKVFVVLGDGECNEGQIWEAAESASHFNLNNLIVIIDNNHLQYDGSIKNIMSNEPFDKKWESFGFDVQLIDGHNIVDIYNSLNHIDDCKPRCIIANTIKGKGISFIENNALWHNHSLNKEQFDNAYKELELD